MHSRGYNCANRTGIPVSELALDLGSTSWSVGEEIVASAAGIRWANGVPECHSALPPGLTLHISASGDNAAATSVLSVGGVLGYDVARPAVYTLHFEAAAPAGDIYSEQYTLQRVIGKVTIHNVRLASNSEFAAAQRCSKDSPAGTKAAVAICPLQF